MPTAKFLHHFYVIDSKVEMGIGAIRGLTDIALVEQHKLTTTIGLDNKFQV